MHAAAFRSSRTWGTLAGTLLCANTQIPIGAGVSSSAAITLATAAGIQLFAEPALKSVNALCEQAYLAESVDLGVGSGWMDFMACGFGGISRIEACSPPKIKALASTLGIPIVLVDTRSPRNTKAVIESLRQRLESSEGRVRDYVRTTPEVVDELAAAVASAPLRYDEIGSLVDQCQYALQHFLGCSTDLIDECVNRCRNAGAFGAKLTGAGCGGALFALVPPDAVSHVLAQLAELPVAAKVLLDVEHEGVR
jgi:mevalonate kinase